MPPTYPKICELRHASSVTFVKISIAQMAPTAR